MERVPFPFYLMQPSVVLSLSAYCMGCHTAAAAAAHVGGGKMLGSSALLWQLVELVLCKLWRSPQREKASRRVIMPQV